MRQLLWAVPPAVLLVLLLAGCRALTGKGMGQQIDDAWITAAVRAKLAAERASLLTAIGADTRQGVVYLTGAVASAAMRRRTTELARQVQGVREVVDHLRVQGDWIDPPDDQVA